MAVKLPIYMDNHATTRVDPRVLDAMLPYFTETYGNAASRTHQFGWAAEAPVEKSRETIADLIGASSGKEIVFTSGATESDNLAIKGVAEYYKSKGNHIVTTSIEHKAVLDSCKRLEKQGFEVTYVQVGADGVVDPADIEEAITDKTILVSVMLANNEVGTIQPIEEIGKITRARGVLAALGRGAGHRQDGVRRAEDERRPRFADGAQDLRAEGRGRAVRPPLASRASGWWRRWTAAGTSAAIARAR